jgi:hypothetical protein
MHSYSCKCCRHCSEIGQEAFSLVACNEDVETQACFMGGCIITLWTSFQYYKYDLWQAGPKHICLRVSHGNHRPPSRYLSTHSANSFSMHMKWPENLCHPSGVCNTILKNILRFPLGWGCSSMTEFLPSMQDALSSIPSPSKTNKQKPHWTILNIDAIHGTWQCSRFSVGG